VDASEDVRNSGTVNGKPAVLIFAHRQPQLNMIEIADRIKSLMFTFDDLQRLNAMAVQVLLRSVDKTKLPLALKGASEKLRDMFFANLSERAGKMLREDIANLGPVKLRDVDDAQASIVALAKDLAAQGEIQISQSKDDEMIA